MPDLQIINNGTIYLSDMYKRQESKRQLHEDLPPYTTRRMGVFTSKYEEPKIAVL